MTESLPAFIASFLSVALAFAAIGRGKGSIASWCFAAGMLVLAAESAFVGIAFRALTPDNVLRWHAFALLAKAFLPAIWLAFSLSYARGNSWEFLLRWRLLIGASFILPVGIAVCSRGNLLEITPLPDGNPPFWFRSGGLGRALDVLILVAFALILMNLEQTFRAAVGTTRWRIKFLLLGVGGIFAARIYSQSQTLLFSGHNLLLANVDIDALLVGCLFVSVAFSRNAFAEVDVYPSHTVLEGSFTVLLAGGYLFLVGVLAQVVKFLGGVRDFQSQVFIVLLVIAVVAVLLFSERLRQRIRRFLSWHFGTSQHDFRKIWTQFTLRMASVLDRHQLCLVSAKLISETFSVLSVTVWILDKKQECLIVGASTASPDCVSIPLNGSSSPDSNLVASLRRNLQPFDLENGKNIWAAPLRAGAPSQFRNGGNRLAVPLIAGDRPLGVAVLADRVNGAGYGLEELDLLKCIGDQMAAGLLNLQLSEELVLAKELEAFQTMSAFFVHDLKNAASSLGLMLRNLPVHFDDPEFRADALRGIGATSDRINHLITRLGALRNKLELKPVEVDLNELLAASLREVRGNEQIDWIENLQPISKVMADREQLQNVFMNLLLNAVEAVGPSGHVTVETRERDGWTDVCVTDDGCGMTEAFLKGSLFRPFQTTKKRGIGIGMFQSKLIIQAHHGKIEVKSEIGKGTTFLVSLPSKS